MVRYHHRLNGPELEQTPGDRIGQKSLVCCSPWGHKELDETQRLKNNNRSRMQNKNIQEKTPNSGNYPQEE